MFSRLRQCINNCTVASVSRLSSKRFYARLPSRDTRLESIRLRSNFNFRTVYAFRYQFYKNHSTQALNPKFSVTKMDEERKEVFSRLPKEVIPTHYSLKLKPDLEKFVFDGEEDITLNIKAESTEVILNSVDLEISDILYTDVAGRTQLPSSHVLNKDDETLKIQFISPLPVGTGTLHVAFKGILNDKLKGFYRSKYKTPEGEERYNAVSQFEATDARRCFPCWDEPAIKAVFDVTLIAPKNRVTLSNMPVKEITEFEGDDKLHVLSYESTPLMSTYLLAFIVGEFDYLEDFSKDGIRCRVYTPVGKKEQGRFALDVCTKVLPYYKEYFGIAYPLSKIDLVAIADFSWGAMENWGLVTYRETALLIDEKESSAVSRQWVAIVIGHELAHQWFGNLVTMEWWTHLWLNEGYASFVEFMCVEHLFPEYDIWTQFVTDTHSRALDLDCLSSSHPIEVPVNNPSEIDEIFDDISYSKGGSVIRMLHNFIGDEDFRKGMNLYLTRHQYRNAFTEDLWQALGEASSRPVGDIMTTWTKQMGFPLIVVEKAIQEGKSRILKLSQQKFWADPRLSSTFQEYNWMVPIEFSTSAFPNEVVHKILMDSEHVTVTIDDVNESDWVKVNPGTFGFYRVAYPSDVLAAFIPAIKSKSLPPLDRLGLVDDIFALVQAGQSSTADVLSILEAYAEEDNYTVWSSISTILGKLNLLLAYTDYHDHFKAHGRGIFKIIAKKVGWEPKPDEGHLQALLRSLVINRMIIFDDEETLKEGKRKFELHISGKETTIPDLRSAVYKAGLADGSQETFDRMLKLYREADNQEEQERITRAFGIIKDPKLIRQVLEFAISDGVRKQDSIIVLCSVGMSTAGRDLTWNFFREKCDFFKNSFPSQLVGRLVKYVVENFVTEEKALEAEEFFREQQFPGTERTVQQSVEQIRLNEAWLERDIAKIGNLFKSKDTRPT